MAARRINRSSTQKSIRQLCQQLSEALNQEIPDNQKTMIIPPHQRHAGVWPKTRMQKFISSIRRNHPIPSILMGSIQGETKLSLEDGLQRLSTLLRFLEGDVTDFPTAQYPQGRRYEEYDAEERAEFMAYTVSVCEYSGATQAERIEIFDNHQNGSPLRAGERLFAHAVTPLVSFVLRTLLTPGEGLYERCTAVWGVRGGEKDKQGRRKELLQYVALVAGIVYGPTYVTKKYEELVDNSILVHEFNEPRALAALVRILEIYEEVEVRSHWGASLRKNQFDMGTFTGFIVYSMHHPSVEESMECTLHSISDSDWEPIKQQWIAYMVKVRNGTRNTTELKRALAEVLHKDVGKARSWSLTRWKNGYLRVFQPDAEVEAPGEESSDDSDESDDE